MTEINLFKDDCLKVMDELIENGTKVDAIITDPPYGNVKGMKLKGSNYDWDDKINTVKMFDKCEKLLKECGALILFAQDPYTFELIDSRNRHSNIIYCYRYAYKKNHFANNLSAKKAPVNYFEDILVFRRKYDIHNENPLRNYFAMIFKFINKPLLEINSILGHRKAEHTFYINSTQFKLCVQNVYDELINVFDIHKAKGFLPYEDLQAMNEINVPIFNLPDGKKYKGNVLEYCKMREDRGYHSAQKPVALMCDLIQTYTNEKHTVLDFAMGSGTTGVACKKLDRNFIGIELDEKYFKIAKKRIFC